MEFFLQQEGNLGTYLFFGALLIGLLYLILPLFAWRIWFWSRQNSRHLQDISTKLELLIREIAPDALPAEDVQEKIPEEKTTDPQIGEVIGIADDLSINEAPPQMADDEEESFFADGDFEGELTEEDSMDFSMPEEFDDIGADLAESEISDFTEENQEDFSSGAEETVDEGAAFDESGDDDELVMDFDEESEEEDFFAEQPEEEPAAPVPPPAEIPVTESASSDFTVEHFESNEEKAFEFEDVDDDPFEPPSDTFEAGDPPTDASTAEPEPAESSWADSPAENIWGDESPAPTSAEPETTEPPGKSDDDEDFSFGAESDLGSAFDEPAKEEDAAKEEENVGDVANSFLSDLEDKLNLDSLAEKPEAAPAPEPAPQPEPESEPESEPEQASSQSTLFARCEGCGHKLAYKQALSGKRVRCPACRTAFALP